MGETGMSKVVLFGELLLRLSPHGNERFVQAQDFHAVYGGTEANVAVSLSQWGQHACYISGLPVHEIGQAACNALRRYGVDTSFLVKKEGRIGVYFYEKGASERAGKVIYDRERSVFSLSQKEDYPFERILEGAQWFHFSGVTAALGGNIREILHEACRIARKKHVVVSCDLNYRSALWDRDTARREMTSLLKLTDVFIGNATQTEELFCISSDLPEGEERTFSAAERLREMFGFRLVAFSERRTINAGRNKIFARVYDGTRRATSAVYDMEMVDRMGGGDAFAAGVIDSVLKGKSPDETVSFAAAASALKHSVEGDFNLVSEQEVRDLVRGADRIVRR